VVRSTVLRLFALVLVLGMVAAACSSNKPSSSAGTPSQSPSAPASTPSESPSAQESSGTLTINGEQANDHGTKDVSGQTEVSIEMDDEFYFKPTVLTGTAGQQLTIELENEGSFPHNFTLEDRSINKDVQSDQKETVTVTFPQSGVLPFFCRFHRSRGMIGELSV
jgi:plastocyanin